MRLVLTEKSSADLRAIYAFSANRWGLEQADRYRERLFSGLDTLIGNPELAVFRSNSMLRTTRFPVMR